MFPVAPRTAKILAQAQQSQCLPLALTMAAALSVQSPFAGHERDNKLIKLLIDNDNDDDDGEVEKVGGECDLRSAKAAAKKRGIVMSEAEATALRTKSQAEALQRSHAAFMNPLSDALTLLNAVRAYHAEGDNAIAQQAFCVLHYLRAKTMTEITSLRAQLSSIINSIEEKLG